VCGLDSELWRSIGTALDPLELILALRLPAWWRAQIYHDLIPIRCTELRPVTELLCDALVRAVGGWFALRIFRMVVQLEFDYLCS
jgi:hypothetical protein